MPSRAQIGRYHVVGHLASGGMAEILLGKLFGPSGFERAVVIKRILPQYAGEKAFRDMFLDEARVVARIQHPNVVHVQELGESGDDLFMVMEYLEGESLQSFLRRAVKLREPLDHALAAHLIAEICGGLHAAHELKDDQDRPLGLVHRDVTPSNIFLTFAGGVKLLDFGVAKFEQRNTATEAGQIKGKYSYMAPELCLAKPIDRRADIFSLGVVFYELITRRRLFLRDNSLMTLRAITEEPVPPITSIVPDCPPSIAAICERALERDLGKRYPTAADMRRDLLRAIRELGYDGDPHADVAALMQRCFEDRIDEKRELIRRVMAGSEITRMPGAEVDSLVELPAAEPVETSHTSSLGIPLQMRRWAPVIGLSAAFAAVGALAALAMSPQEPTPVAEAAAEPAPAPAPEPPEPLAPSPVQLTFRSQPSGAAVWIDGALRGETPVTLEVPYGERRLAVELRHDGYDSVTREVLPTANAQLELSLTPTPRSKTRPSMRAAPMDTAMNEMSPPMMTESTMGGSPFRRFN